MKTKENIALEFNSFSKNYTKDMIACVPHYKALLSGFSTYLPANFNPKSILDLGCGNGNVTAQLISLFPTANYTLVDASEEMINLCRNQFKGFDVDYANCYFKDFLFEKEPYDLIVAGFSLHHCDEMEKQYLFKKIYASLKPIGIFMCCDLMINKTNTDHPKLIEQWGKFVNSNFPDGEKWAWIMEHYDVFDNPTDYSLQLKWLKKAGFTDVQISFKKDYWIFLQATK